IIFFGLVIVGVFNFKFLMKNKQLTFKNRPTGFIGSFFIGMSFYMGWTLCMEPILAVVLSLAATQPDKGMVLMISYILGFAIPFLTLSFFVVRLNYIKKHIAKLMKVVRYIMVFVVISLFFDWMTKITYMLAAWTSFQVF